MAIYTFIGPRRSDEWSIEEITVVNSSGETVVLQRGDSDDFTDSQIQNLQKRFIFALGADQEPNPVQNPIIEGLLDSSGLIKQELLPPSTSTLSGVGEPTAIVDDDTTYLERDLSGQVIAEWLRESGSWIRILGPPAFAKASRVATQAIPYNVMTYISYDTEDEDVDGMINLASNAAIITASRPGIYTLHGQVNFAANSTQGMRRVGLLRTFVGVAEMIVNGTAPSPGNATPAPTTLNISADVRAGTGDWFGMQVQHQLGTGINLDVTGWLTARWVRP